MKLLFLDESGDHNLSVIDPQYPVFVLGGIIVDEIEYNNTIEPAINEFKMKLFGTKDIILHTSDISRNRLGFEQLKSAEFRTVFYAELNKLMCDLNYKVVACVIKKQEHIDNYGFRAIDPYLLSLNVLIERFIFELSNNDKGVIISEARGGKLDNELELAWLDVKIQGTKFIKSTRIKNSIENFAIRRKADNIIGLQLADLVISRIARKSIGKSVKNDYLVIEQKIRKDKFGNINGYGIVTMPK